MRFDGIIRHIRHFRGQITHTPRFRGIITVEPEPKTAFAIYSADDNSLVFYKNYDLENITVGGTYKGKTVTGLYTGFETDDYIAQTDLPWNGVVANIVTVSFADVIRPLSMLRWFSLCSALTKIENIKNLDTRNVTNMTALFQGCENLIDIDLSNFNTSKVTGMAYMFRKCATLTSLDLSTFDTRNVTDMSQMFYECKGITSLDLSNFDTSNVTAMNHMFYHCDALTSVDVSSFDTRNVTTTASMFGYTALTILDLSNFDTSNVTAMNHMFSNCTALAILDLSGFDTSKVTNMSYMFYNCSALTTIFASSLWSVAALTTWGHMFNGCARLVGGNGTVLDTNISYKTRACIDTASTPGYLTLKQNHLYNGTEILDIRFAWANKADYPHAILQMVKYNGEYCPMVCFFKVALTYQAVMSTNNNFPTGTKLPSIYTPKGGTVYWCRSYFVNGEWTEPTFVYHAATNESHYLWVSGLFWTNHDIKDTSGNIYMAASDPIPMGE